MKSNQRSTAEETTMRSVQCMYLGGVDLLLHPRPERIVQVLVASKYRNCNLNIGTFVTCLPFPGLLCLLIVSVSSGPLYVQRGSDIIGCNMKCPNDDDKVTLELSRQCGGEEETLLERQCYKPSKSDGRRLRLDTGKDCWKLTSARKDDSCVYKVWCHCKLQRLMSSTVIRILDPVLISNITSTRVRLGQDMLVNVQFSGEESVVIWDVDGKPLPKRYLLMNGNRTLIIPSVQKDDGERTFWVRITNPISEETREYRLEMGDREGRPDNFSTILNVLAIQEARTPGSAGKPFFGPEKNMTRSSGFSGPPEISKMICSDLTLPSPLSHYQPQEHWERNFPIQKKSGVKLGKKCWILEDRTDILARFTRLMPNIN
ncbi:uncharacterized protein ACMZJ9_001398 [Mantella aurantiaca]